MSSIDLWLAVAMLAGVALIQWATLRHLHRKRLAAEQARFAQAQRIAAQLAQQARRQVAQLQQDLAAARLEAKQAARSAGRPAPGPLDPAIVRARAVLDKHLDAAVPPARPTMPADGFADTLPSMALANDASSVH